jgi:AcrR family transcriptional regulator
MSRESQQWERVGGKRERTRAALVAAALAVIEERGFAAASLEEIAARAGMTKGAIYSNFPSKGALLLAAMSAKGLTLSSARAPAKSVGEELSAMAGELAAALAPAQGQAAFLAGFQAYALTDPELRRLLAATYADAFTLTADYLAGLPDRRADLPPRVMAAALQSVALGLMMQSLITPEEITPEVVARTLQALALGFAA